MPMMPRSTFVSLVLMLLAVGGTAESGTYDAEPEWRESLWQDLQLLLSFIMGVLFMSSAEKIFDTGDTATNASNSRMPRSTFVSLVLMLLAVGGTAESGTYDAEPEWRESLWQDLQLLLSFIMGVLFMSSAEKIFDTGDRATNASNSRMPRSTFVSLVLMLLAVGGTAESGTYDAEPEWRESLWQDLQLLLSFIMGVLFMSSAEKIFDTGDRATNASNSRLTKLELYPLLA
ncbi:unnamed protein product [Effrenium voratum]|uniref:Uncharacterized protein n=1 Tax=Effrenium voratum TaxID=2562239 RepID=A0AA36MPS6_9DINO|nr:unnamed protein product [Effrenium voratum]